MSGGCCNPHKLVPHVGVLLNTPVCVRSRAEFSQPVHSPLNTQVPNRSDDRAIITCIQIQEACGFNMPRCAHDIVVDTLLSAFQQNPFSQGLAKWPKPYKFNYMLNVCPLAPFWLQEKGFYLVFCLVK